MTKISATSEYDAPAGLFAAVVQPGPGAPVKAFRSAPIYDTHAQAVMAGLAYVEANGHRIDWHVVGTLLA